MAETVNTTPPGVDGSPPLGWAMLPPPLVSPTLVSRPRLLVRLDEAALGPITILSGEPAAIKFHASHVYTKLGVSGRAAAADAARRLDLV